MEAPAWWVSFQDRVPRHADRLTLAACLPGVFLVFLYAGVAARAWSLPSGKAVGVVGVVACFTVALLSLAAAVAWLAQWRSWTNRLVSLALVLFSGLFWTAGSIIWMFLTFE